MKPGKLIQREERWALPVAISAFAAFAALIASFAVGSGAVQGETAQQVMADIAANSGSLTISAVLRAIGLVLLVPPFVYLFEAVAGRETAVRRWVGVLVIVGPLMFASYTMVTAMVSKNAAEDFQATKATLYVEPPASIDAFIAEVDEDPRSVRDVQFYPEKDQFDALNRDGKVFTMDADADDRARVETAVDEAGVDSNESATGEGGDLAVPHFFDQAAGISAARFMSFPSLFFLMAGLLYTSLWGMRVGLLTRFFGSLGMALAISLLIFGPQLGLVVIGLWTVSLGLMALDRWPGGRPPAWDAGDSVPWPVRGAPRDDDRGKGGDSSPGSTLDTVDEDGNLASSGTGRRRKRKQRSR